MEPGPCAVCGAFAHNGHHRKLRSQGGDEKHWNIIRLCGSGTTGCHGLVHAHPELAYECGLLVHSWDDPREVDMSPTMFRDRLGIDLAVTHGKSYQEVVEHTELEPGKDCPTCHRRVPHPKKESSPVTKVKGIRVPVGDVETFNEQLDAAAEYLGCKSKPHHLYWAVQYALIALLQNPEFEGALKDES